MQCRTYVPLPRAAKDDQGGEGKEGSQTKARLMATESGLVFALRQVSY
jgi:hypothetical protein